MYELLVYVHILGAVVWLGGGITFRLLARKSLEEGEDTAALRYFDSLDSVGGPMFGIAPPVTLLAGIGLVIWSEAWKFSDVWVYLSLALIVLAIIFGAVLTDRSAKSLRSIAETEGAASREFATELSRFMRFGAMDVVVILLILGLMVFKPGA